MGRRWVRVPVYELRPGLVLTAGLDGFVWGAGPPRDKRPIGMSGTLGLVWRL